MSEPLYPNGFTHETYVYTHDGFDIRVNQHGNIVIVWGAAVGEYDVLLAGAEFSKDHVKRAIRLGYWPGNGQHTLDRWWMLMVRLKLEGRIR